MARKKRVNPNKNRKAKAIVARSKLEVAVNEWIGNPADQNQVQEKPKLTPYTEQYAAKAKEFYLSPAWRYLRYDVFLRDGKICAVCGATPEDGTRLHVDHIIPLRQDWSLRLKAENLQVLCEECNQGKGSRDSTDWRPRRGSPTQN